MPTVSIEGARQAEGTTTSDPNFLSWTISLSEAATGPVTVDLRYLSGSALQSQDAYRWSSPASVTFAVGETSKQVSYRIDADAVPEADETIVLEAYEVSGPGVTLAGNARVLRSESWILDDDGGSNKRALFVSNPDVVEGDGGARQAVFEISLSRPATSAFTIDYRTVDGTARAGEDYVATSGRLTFSEGQSIASVRVPVSGDRTVEGAESFLLAIDAPAAVAEVTMGTAEILDDDAGAGAGVPSVSLRGSAATPEGTTTSDPNFLSWTISLSEAATGPVTVDLRYLSGSALQSQDAYRWSSPASVTFAVGETSKQVSYRIDADAVPEADETIVLEAYGVSGAAVLAGNARVLRSESWILDDDGGSNKRALFVSNPDVVEGDGGARQAVFEISLSRPATSAFTIDYRTVDGTARAGEDYVATSGRLTFSEGQSIASVRVPVSGDRTVEGAESFLLAIDAPAAVAEVTMGTAEILDDDAGAGAGVPSVSLRGSADSPEGTTSSDPNFLSWTISLSEAATGPVTVDLRYLSGSALEAVDGYRWSSPASVTFAVGETSKQVSYRIDADAVPEADETIVLEAYGVSGAAVLAGNARVLRSESWILDDDGGGTKLALYAANPIVNELAGEAVFNISLSRAAPTDFSVSYRTIDGTARGGSDYKATTGSISFVEGQSVAQVAIRLFSNRDIEDTETFTLAFGSTSRLGAAPSVEARILDGSIRGTAAGEELRGTPGNDAIYGFGGDDFIFGAGGVDFISAGDGNDNARGGPGSDLMYGGRGNDKLFGDAGNDRMYGQSGNDRLYGSLDKDSLYGGGGNDFLDGGAGADRMLGGNGNDIYIVDNKNDVVVESSRSGVDTVRSSGEMRLAANVENLLLRGGRDIDGTGNALGNVIRGNSGDNTLRGLDGNDLLKGGAGNDRLIGGDDKDRLLGGAGKDTMSGNSGEDRFLFRSASDSAVGANRDVITDFDRSEDQIDLRSIDADSRARGNQEFDFIGSRGFTRDAGEVRFSGGILSGDVNGDGRADFEVALTGVTNLSVDDFLL